MGNYNIVFEVARIAYIKILRNALKMSIEDPRSEHDDIILGICDRIFMWEEEEV